MMADLSEAHRGMAQLRPKPGRVRKIVATITRVLAEGRLATGLCATLCGKVEYTATSGACGRVGRGPLAALRAWQHRAGRSSWPRSSRSCLAARFISAAAGGGGGR